MSCLIAYLIANLTLSLIVYLIVCLIIDYLISIQFGLLSVPNHFLIFQYISLKNESISSIFRSPSLEIISEMSSQYPS